MRSAHFIYDVTEKNADLYYATGFTAPDAFIFFMHRGKKYMVMNDLEFDRARKEAHVDQVLSINKYIARARARISSPGQSDVIHEILRERGIKSLIVPGKTSFALVDALRKKGYTIKAGPHPFFSERLKKDSSEKRCIEDVQRCVFAAMGMARDAISSSSVKGGRLVLKGSTLTSERLRSMINVFLMERGCVASDTIVACGRHSIDPHDTGSGPLMPNKSIIVDIFPRSTKTFYYGDATRTFCKGRAPEKLSEMYATVKEGQALGIKMVRDGANGRKIHEAILQYFSCKGFHTGEKDGHRQGFFHGTGHGVGLELHEEPSRINPSDYVLKKGNVVSVEPGLYYEGIGGVRIEDLVYVTRTGCDVLGSFPKKLEV